MSRKHTTLLLRASISIGFLSAVADRFGLWNKQNSAWGNWENFVTYTHQLNPWAPSILILAIATITTLLEILFSVCLLINFKTSFIAKLSGYLLLLFAIAMTFSISIKLPLDYSVYCAAAAAFGLSELTSTKAN